MRARIKSLFLWWLSRVARAVPTEPRLWLFGSSTGFDGNSKAFFLWVGANEPSIFAVRITDDPELVSALRQSGLRAELRLSWRAVWLGMRARCHVYNTTPADILPFTSHGALYVNLWHGVGLKAMGHSRTMDAPPEQEHDRPRLTREVPRHASAKSPDIVLSTSAEMTRHFARVFLVAEDRCPVLGYPRLDYAVDEALTRSALSVSKWSLPAGVETYLYMPTWRDVNADFFPEAIPDLEMLSRTLAVRSAQLLIKMHPNSPQLSMVDESLTNIHLLSPDFDIYPHLSYVDVLITDYSSVFYDWIALRDSGVILYHFDHERYVSTDRSLIASWTENVTGVFVENLEELCGAIEHGSALQSLDPRLLARLREKFWGGSPHPASASIFRYLSEFQG